MRLDKFLKVSRLIKRRTVAKDVCTAGKVSVNDRVAKAGTEVAVGDEIAIRFGEKTLVVEVLDIKETVRANEADQLYRIIRQ
ncbi:RNA-binding S4 domain-containing protein [Peptococcus simiae]|uniref:RNA-binding S4 domain-containing protein n=1 Tax=Peptococcus simiae TaxID=1643805 RepID=UPI003980FDEB